MPMLKMNSKFNYLELRSIIIIIISDMIDLMLGGLRTTNTLKQKLPEFREWLHGTLLVMQLVLVMVMVEQVAMVEDLFSTCKCYLMSIGK